MGSPSTGNARPYEGNGHYYAFTSKKIKWPDALAESEKTSLNGTWGYLATITSSGENSFIQDKSKAGSAITNNAFIGGTDHNDRGTWEGRWIWYGQNAPEAGTVFREGGPTMATRTGIVVNQTTNTTKTMRSLYVGILGRLRSR